MENKYESIEKSLSPYKIQRTTPAPPTGPPPPPPPPAAQQRTSRGGTSQQVNISIRKQLQQNGHGGQAILPQGLTNQQLLANNNLLLSTFSLTSTDDRSPSVGSLASSSSHYAQISPLRGVAVGNRNGKSYFQVRTAILYLMNFIFLSTCDGGIVVSIAAFQAVDPGSIPGHRNV